MTAEVVYLTCLIKENFHYGKKMLCKNAQIEKASNPELGGILNFGKYALLK